MTAGFSLRFNCGLSARPTNYLSMITTHQNNQPTSAEHALTFLQLYDKRCNFHFATNEEIKYTGATAAVTSHKWSNSRLPKTSGRNSVHLTSSPTSSLSHSMCFFHQEITKDSSNLKLLFRKHFFLRQNHQNEQREAAFPGRLHQETPCKSNPVPVDACNY